VSGQTNSFGAGDFDLFLLKYDSTGAFIWQQTWGETLYENSTCLAVDSASGVLFVGGNSDSFGTGDYEAFVLQYNTTGSLLTQEVWSGNPYSDVRGLTLGSDGALYLAGYAVDSSSSWRSISGTVNPGLGTAGDITGNVTDTLWVPGVPTGTLDDLVGVVDTGGGNADQLIVKENPLFW
jgi:hypothetical protein